MVAKAKAEQAVADLVNDLVYGVDHEFKVEIQNFITEDNGDQVRLLLWVKGRRRGSPAVPLPLTISPYLARSLGAELKDAGDEGAYKAEQSRIESLLMKSSRATRVQA